MSFVELLAQRPSISTEAYELYWNYPLVSFGRLEKKKQFQVKIAKRKLGFLDVSELFIKQLSNGRNILWFSNVNKSTLGKSEFPHLYLLGLDSHQRSPTVSALHREKYLLFSLCIDRII